VPKSIGIAVVLFAVAYAMARARKIISRPHFGGLSVASLVHVRGLGPEYTVRERYIED